jgi:hypothetical protein
VAEGASDGQPLGSIRSFLERVRAGLYRHDARRAALWAVSTILAAGLALPLLAHGVVATRAGALALLWGGCLIAALAVIVGVIVGIVVPRRRFGADADVARWVGGREPPVASDLLSCVELAAAAQRLGAGRRAAPSPALVDALHTATATRIGGLDAPRLIPPRPMRIARRTAALLVVANAAAFAVAPRAMAGGWRALVAPGPRPYDGATPSAVPLVADLEVTLTYPAYTARPPDRLAGASGDFRALPGTKVEIVARALVAPAAARVVIEPDGTAPPTTIAMTIEATPAGEHLVRAAWEITTSGRYRFGLTDGRGRASIEATPHAIELEVDQAPQVELIAPADTLDVTNLRRIELAYVIEDDHGIAGVDLVWSAGKDNGRKPVAFATATGETPSPRTQGKFVWDMAEVPLPPGAEVRYWLEARDNDTVRGPNVGKSRELALKVFSPRERHEQYLARQEELAEKMLRALAVRLPGLGDDGARRHAAHRDTAELVPLLAGLVVAYDKDPHAAPALEKTLDAMRGRLDKLVAAEARLLDKVPAKPDKPQKGLGARFGASDPRLVAELEDDTIAVIDWLDRERLEGVLDLADEIASHHKRLDELFAELARTGDKRIEAEIERELRALAQLEQRLAQQRGGLAEDVLDRFVHADAIADKSYADCIDQVGTLFARGDAAAAQQKLATCRQQFARATGGLEQALSGLRGDRFGDEQQLLDEVLDGLADLSKDQDDIAAEADEIFDRYAEAADDLARAHGRDAQKKTAGLIDKLRRRLDDVPEAGLTPFADEELDIVRRRIGDVERMVGDGDLAEAAEMARQAASSLDTIEVELESALDDDPHSRFARATSDALDAIERAHPVADELIDALDDLAPSPDQILDDDDRDALDRLRRRQAMNAERAKKLADKTTQRSGDLPGDAGPELAKRLGEAATRMGSAADRMKAHDPGGARQEARSAADLLGKARQQAQGAARQQQHGAADADEPIRIPGADAYRAPEKFREDILEAMKRRAPDGYDDQVRRYYEELIR